MTPMYEVLTKEIAREYHMKAQQLPLDEMQDVGRRRELRLELQKRCNLTEIVAINIINGFHVMDYVTIEEIKEKKMEESVCD